MNTLRIGVIGCGAMGKAHAKRFSELPSVVVAGLSDPSETAMRQTAGAMTSPPEIVTTDYRELLDGGLDAVCIASPDSRHVPQVLDALAAGLHVFCEKPLTPDRAELDAVIAARDEAGKMVAMTYPRRYDGGSRAMKREIHSGGWGRVKAVAAYCTEDWITPNVNTWRHDPAHCPGGFFYDASGHQLDAMLWATGLEAEWVEAESDNCGTCVPLCVWGSARLVGGVPFAFSFRGDSLLWRENVIIFCEKMEFSIENLQTYWVKDGRKTPIEPREPEAVGEDAFVRLIMGEGPNLAPLEDIRPLIHLTQCTLESAETGKGVCVPSANPAR